METVTEFKSNRHTFCTNADQSRHVSLPCANFGGFSNCFHSSLFQFDTLSTFINLPSINLSDTANLTCSFVCVSM